MCGRDCASKYRHQTKVNKQAMNFFVYYEVDEEVAQHALSLNNYHMEDNGEAEYHHWNFA